VPVVLDRADVGGRPELDARGRRSGSRLLSRLPRSARAWPLRLLPRRTRRLARRNTRQRSGKTPQTAKKPGLGAGPGHPEPRRERRDISRPFGNDHAG
jgi:hypothetical protein